MRIRDKLFKEGTKTRQILRKWNIIIHLLKITNLKELIKQINEKGIKQTFTELEDKYISGEIEKSNLVSDYQKWIKANEPNEEELQKQKETKFEYEPKISLLVPLYKTPRNFFEELVQCLKDQTYSNWELCLGDGSPKENKGLKDIIESDERIKYKALDENKGIAGNTNECIKLATGDFIALFDHDDLLPKFSLYEVVKAINENPQVEFLYSDEDKITSINRPRFDPYFKPDFAIDTLRSNNYICHFSVFKRELLEKLDGERDKYNGAQDFDLIIRMTEITDKDKIVHIPKILYHWRVHKDSTAKAGGKAKPYAFEAGISVLEDHLKRQGLEGKVSHGETLGAYRIDYKVIGDPKVSILIPNKDGIKDLKICIKSILKLTTYKNYEIVIIENNSERKATFDYYKKIEKNDKIKVIYYPDKGFNYSKIINFGVKNVYGDYIIQLNNDTKLLTPNWLENMLGFAQREDIGAVGVKMYYPDSTIQHAGVIIGIGGVAGHVFKNLPKGKHGYFSKESMIQNLSAVTAACIMTPKSIYDEVGYMDEKYKVAFNDIDFCLKIREKGKLIVYNPYVQFIHYESKSRGLEDTPEKQARFKTEIDRFHENWKEVLDKGDPYYNKNLRLDNDQYAIRTEKV